MAEQEPATGTRAQKKDDVRGRISDAVIALLLEGGEINHDLVSDKVGVARRTVYRYFPDRQALLAAATSQMRELAEAGMAFPETEAELLGTLHEIHTGFDKVAPIATLVRSTPQGRAIRLSQIGWRKQSYTAAAADAVKDLSEEDQLLATAMLQVLHTAQWLEMRDHWGLTGAQIAKTSAWAIRTLLADLRAGRRAPRSVTCEHAQPAPSVRQGTSPHDSWRRQSALCHLSRLWPAPNELTSSNARRIGDACVPYHWRGRWLS